MRRYVPEEPLPPYTYIAGWFPHPTRDPEGHSFGKPPPEAKCPEPDRWENCRLYLRGIDLFNHGYYWEAHEIWECLWHACGRKGLTGRFLQALIRLAAAGVKAREGMPRGVTRHGTAARKLIQEVVDELGASRDRYMGLRLDELCEFASQVAVGEGIGTVRPETVVGVVFKFVLQPA
jgi:predicted metal-dependent hydrolase